MSDCIKGINKKELIQSQENVFIGPHGLNGKAGGDSEGLVLIKRPSRAGQ